MYNAPCFLKLQQMKNIKDRINSQLFKAQEIELSAEKVELGMLQDFENLYDLVNKEANKTFNDTSMMVKDLQKKASENISLIDRATKKAQLIESKAKDLGLEIPKEVQKKLESLKEDEDMLIKLRASLKSVSKSY